jgi:hypothetical protein
MVALRPKDRAASTCLGGTGIIDGIALAPPGCHKRPGGAFIMPIHNVFSRQATARIVHPVFCKFPAPRAGDWA